MHHGDPVGDLGDDAEIVGDEQHRHATGRLYLPDQREYLRLRRHVERGGRLVGDQDVGLERERHRDHRALPLAAGDLVRIRVEHARRLGQMHRSEHVEDAPAPFRARYRLVYLDRLLDLAAEREHRVQRRHRFLEDHRDAAAAQLAESRRRRREQVLAAVEYPPAGRFHVAGWEQAQDRARHHRLAGSRLAHDAQDLVVPQFERHVVDSARTLGPRRKVDAKAIDDEDRLAVHARLRTIADLHAPRVGAAQSRGDAALRALARFCSPAALMRCADAG